MSVLIFAGGAQFLAVGLLAAGNPIAAVLAGLLLNARHLPFGLVVADTIGPRWRDRLVGSHIMTDETVAFALAEPDPAARRKIYWTVGATLFVTWNTGVLLGALLGGATGDPDALGLDAAFPAGLIALILPSLRDRETRLAALTGAAVAVLLTPILPAGLPVMCALLGLAVLFRPGRPRDTTPQPPAHSSDRNAPAAPASSARPDDPYPPAGPVFSARPDDPCLPAGPVSSVGPDDPCSPAGPVFSARLDDPCSPADPEPLARPGIPDPPVAPAAPARDPNDADGYVAEGKRR
jgi:4-azaleucine resistance transporter AzlC